MRSIAESICRSIAPGEQRRDSSDRPKIGSDLVFCVRPPGLEPGTCGLRGRGFLAGNDRPVREPGVLSTLPSGQSGPDRPVPRSLALT